MCVLSSRIFAALLACLAAASLSACSSVDNFEPLQAVHVSPASTAAVSYYVEFRGRSEVDGYGHSYITLGYADTGGRSHRTTIFGFVPTTADDQFWSQFAVPVGGTIAVTKSDFTPHPDVRFRVPLKRADYLRITRDLAASQQSWTVYLLVGHSCNDLMAEVARSVGLATPALTILLPVAYVAELKAINMPHTQ